MGAVGITSATPLSDAAAPSGAAVAAAAVPASVAASSVVGGGVVRGGAVAATAPRAPAGKLGRMLSGWPGADTNIAMLALPVLLVPLA